MDRDFFDLADLEGASCCGVDTIIELAVAEAEKEEEGIGVDS